jgi:hypothetical protein
VIESDASADQLGAVILQEETVEEGSPPLRPIAYLSRSCNAAERNYSLTEREALTAVWAIKMARPYVKRTRFVVRTDHQALRWLFASSHENNFTSCPMAFVLGREPLYSRIQTQMRAQSSRCTKQTGNGWS